MTENNARIRRFYVSEAKYYVPSVNRRTCCPGTITRATVLAKKATDPQRGKMPVGTAGDCLRKRSSSDYATEGSLDERHPLRSHRFKISLAAGLEDEFMVLLAGANSTGVHCVVSKPTDPSRAVEGRSAYRR